MKRNSLTAPLKMNQQQYERWCRAVAGTGKAYHVLVLHDDRCSPGICQCVPAYEVRPATPQAFVHGHVRQEEWIAECKQRAN